MLGLILGIPAGFVLVFKHKTTRDKSLAAKLGIGLLAGLGACIGINAAVEIIQMIMGG